MEDVIRIVLPSGAVAIIDKADSWVMRLPGSLVATEPRRGTFYVKHMEDVEKTGSGRKIRQRYLHRLMLPDAEIVDHINGDGLDNRRCNLRAASLSQNARNRRLGSHNTSGVRGVFWNKQKGKWQAKIEHFGKVNHVGFFACINEAKEAWFERAAQLWSEDDLTIDRMEYARFLDSQREPQRGG